MTTHFLRTRNRQDGLCACSVYRLILLSLLFHVFTKAGVWAAGPAGGRSRRTTTAETQTQKATFLGIAPGLSVGQSFDLDSGLAAGQQESLSRPLPRVSTALHRSAPKPPLFFEQNDGQAAAEVAFLSRGPGYSLFLTMNEAVMVLKTAATRAGAECLGLRPSSSAFGLGDAEAKPLEDRRNPSPFGDATLQEESGSSRVLRMRLVGANSSPAIRGEAMLPAKANYFIGNDPSRWRTNLPTFGNVRYEQVYPGIGLVYYGNEGRLEYDFVVAPGADPNQIAMEFEGADGLRIQEGGELVLNVGGREMRWQKPLIYQEVNGMRREIAGKYRMRQGPDQSANVAAAGTPSTPDPNVPNVHFVSFELADYDPGLPLVIDPILIYSTYLGGSGADGAQGVAVDAQSNLYLAGFTDSIDFPIKAAISDTAPGGEKDVFVAKISPAGELLYCTYLGGSDNKFSDDVKIAVTATGECHVAGTTSSQDFPLVNPLQSIYGGGEFDVFVTSLKADGSALLFSTYLGGEAWDGAGDIAIGPNDDIFLVGYTRSVAFPTRNAFQPQLSSPSGGTQFSDSFVTRLEAGGKSILYSTYYGRSATIEKGSGVVVDQDGNAYVAIWVYGLTVNQSWQYLIAKISPDGSTRLFERRWPSNMAGQYMFPPNIALVSSNSVAVAGEVQVPNLSAVNQPDPSISLGYFEGYIALFSTTNGSYLSAVYLGGSGSDYISGLKADATGEIIVAGYTSGPGLQASGFPVTDPLSSGPDPGKSWDVFVTKLRPPNLTIAFSTLLGGPGDDYTTGLALDPSGNVLVAGYTGGQFPMVDAFQPEIGGGISDAFLLKLGFGERLKISFAAQGVTISWPASATNFLVEASTSLPTVSWDVVTNTPTVSGRDRSVQLPATGNARFFRLRNP